MQIYCVKYNLCKISRQYQTYATINNHTNMKNVIKRYEAIIVCVLAILVTTISSSSLISQYLNKPTQHVFVGISHYWEDYFYYLDQFYQGAHDQWLTINRFTHEQYPSTLFYFNHILLGKILGLFGLASYASYNISLLLLKFFFIIISYSILSFVYKQHILHRLAIFILFLFTTNLPLLTKVNGISVLKNLDITRTASPFMERFGNIPNTLMINCIFLISTLLVARLVIQITKNRPKKSILRNTIITTVFLTLLSIGDATKTLVLLSSTGVLVLILYFRKRFSVQNPMILLSSLLLLVLPQIITYLTISSMLKNNPVYQYTINWNVANQTSWSSVIFQNPFAYIHIFGLLGLLFVVGLVPFINKKKTILEELGFIIVLISIIGYHLPIEKILPIPRFRFLFPSLYVFNAIIAHNGLLFISSKTKQSVIPIVLVLYIAINSITIGYRFKQNIVPLKEPDFHFAYLPNQLFEGLKQLESLPQEDTLVLAGPHSSMDILIPGFTGKRTFTGHMLTTHNVEQKDELGRQFYFLQMDTEQAKNFLKENNISYVFITQYDGDKKIIQSHYSFLQVAFENNGAAIYTY